MIFNDYLNSSEFFDAWKLQYPSFFSILELKFYDFNVMYEQDRLDKLINSFLIENYNELTKFVNLEKQMLEVFLKENYGSLSDMDVVNNPNEVSTSILSYDGLSNDGDFNKTTNTHTGNSTNNTKQKSVNYLEVFISLNQIKLASLYIDLIKDFGNKFLQLCYNN